MTAILLGQHELVFQVLVLNLSNPALGLYFVLAIVLSYVVLSIHILLFNLAKTSACVYVDLTLRVERILVPLKFA